MKKYVIEKGCIKRYERVVIFTKTFENSNLAHSEYNITEINHKKKEYVTLYQLEDNEYITILATKGRTL